VCLCVCVYVFMFLIPLSGTIYVCVSVHLCVCVSVCMSSCSLYLFPGLSMSVFSALCSFVYLGHLSEYHLYLSVSCYPLEGVCFVLQNVFCKIHLRAGYISGPSFWSTTGIVVCLHIGKRGIFLCFHVPYDSFRG